MITVFAENRPTLVYAGRELCKYLDKMLGCPTGTLVTAGCPESAPVIELRVEPALAPVAAPELDDAVAIDIREGAGFIAGTNPRAVLLGVYRFLRALGCRFVRTKEDGEVIPRLRPEELTVSLRETASFRHRGVVIEGADSVENVLDFIEWLPKAGYNAFFTQFMDLSCFFRRWYSHDENPLLSPEPYDEELSREYESRIWREIARRGLHHHAMGHGWTTEPLGIEGRGWDEVSLDISPGNRELLAMVNGRRELFEGVAAGTNLCYSNPRARKIICDYAVQYLKDHPGVKYLHLWLADSIHSFCECENCRKKLPADWYMILLGELDERLTAEKIDTKVVYLLYLDLLFPPKTERLKNKDRFVLMFAPISRPFSQSLADFRAGEAPEDYILNETPIPRTIEKNLACLKAWKDYMGDGFDSFDFDYYMGRAHYGDPGYCAIAKVIEKDIDHLPRLGLNGILSCQELRAFYPTGLPAYLLGLKLWDSTLTYDHIADEYFTAAYGERGGEVRALLEEVSDCFDIDFWFRGRPAPNPDLAEKMKKALPLAQKAKEIAVSAAPENPCEELSFHHLALYERYLTHYADTMIRCAEGDMAGGRAAWEEFCRFLRETELFLQPHMDAYRIQAIARNFFFGPKLM
ncbi:MAG: DUF4838 domain-containing protein [Oscillospiraceae bacterium]|nr:DUF4838 domain-containing protein [Oscillospiraceae bacterium]